MSDREQFADYQGSLIAELEEYLTEHAKRESYAVLTPPKGSNSSGFVLGFHGGAWYDVTSRFFVNAQIGYQFGYQSVSSNLDLGSNYFLFGLGAGTRI